jgi:hypothetical protein
MMKQIIRYAIVLILLGGVLLLAGNPAALAGEAQRPVLQAGQASVKGYVWNDADQDGVQDAGESGIRNVTVRLYDKDKKLVKNTKTDDSGRYLIEGIAPGDYYVDIMAPAVYTISPRDQGQDDAVDSDTDPLTGETSLIQLVAGENLLKGDTGLIRRANPAQQDPGTVRPPPSDVTTCQDGYTAVGGVSTLEVNNLASGYCLAAFLRNSNFALGRIPDGAGRALANITFLRVFRFGSLVSTLPEGDGDVQICYSVPSGITQSQIYFYDFYGPRQGQGGGQRNWEPLETTVTNGVACADAQNSGAYALIGQ